MDKKFVLMFFTLVFLLLATLRAQFLMPSAADPAVIRVPEDYLTIQEATNAANPGDIVEVAAGTYYENVVVNKSLSLIGENKSTTIIDGSWTGAVLNITADDVKIAGFTIRNSGPSGWFGIYIFSSSNTISGNIISDNLDGIFLRSSSGNTISGNMISPYYGVGIWLEDYSNNNTLNGNIMDPGPGLDQIGILVAYSRDNVISDNIILKNGYYGIRLFQSQLNKIIGNNIINNGLFGINFVASSGNTIYHNNLINNGVGDGGSNTWDNGAEGNYWSDYDGEDLNGDGIGDTLLPHQGVDFYPLMTPWNEFRVFNIPWEEEVYQVTTFSHSTIASFNFSHLDKQISFNVTGPPGTSGFCNVTIPKTLLGANETHPWQVLLDGNPINYNKVENETHTFLYFTYTHTTHHVQIIGTWVTPEFPTALILPLLIITALLATILGKMTHSTKKPQSLC